MVFGIDDVVAAAIAASTSYFAWSKIDYLMERVKQTCKPQLRRRLERASESPTFLMSGFELKTAQELPHRGRFSHRRSLAFLLSCTDDEMEAHLQLFTPVELLQAFHMVGKHSLHEQGVRLTRACIGGKVEVRPDYVEATLVALLNGSAYAMGADYYEEFGRAMPICQKLVTALVVGNTSYPARVKGVIATARTGHSVLDAELLTAAASALSTDDWECSQRLFEEYCTVWGPKGSENVLSGMAMASLACANRVTWLLRQVSTNCPRSEACIWLRYLSTERGAAAYTERKGHIPTWATAVDLFESAQSPANALTCAQILMSEQFYQPHAAVKIAREVAFSDVQWGTLGCIVGRSGDAEAAAAIAEQMIERSNVSPAMVLRPVADKGMWSTALRLLTLSLTHRRVIPSASEIGLAINASIELKKWAAALFWLDRAHASLTRLPPSTYDRAFVASRHVPWESTERAVHAMRECGGSCTEEGVLNLLSAAAVQRRTPDTLRLLSNSNTVNWVQ